MTQQPESLAASEAGQAIVIVDGQIVARKAKIAHFDDRILPDLGLLGARNAAARASRQGLAVDLDRQN